MKDKDSHVLRLHRKVWVAVKKQLTNDWKDVAEVFKKGINAEDAAQRIVLEGQPGASKQGRQRGRQMLTQEVLEWVIAKGICEAREEGGRRQIRLKPTSTAAVGAEPTTTSQEATAVPEPARAISPNTPCRAGGVTMQDMQKQLDGLRRKVRDQLDKHLRERMKQAMQGKTADPSVVQRCWQSWDEVQQLIAAEDATERALLSGDNVAGDAAVHHGRELLGSEVLHERLGLGAWHTQEESGRVFVRCDLGPFLEGALQVRACLEHWLKGKEAQSLTALQEQVAEDPASHWAVLHGTPFDHPDVVRVGRELLCSEVVKQMRQEGIVETTEENGELKIRLATPGANPTQEAILTEENTEPESSESSQQNSNPESSAADDLVIDPEFAALIPPHKEEEKAQLEDILRQEGRCRDALVVWKGRRIVLDGMTRRELCIKLGIRYEINEIELPDRAAAKRWIYKNQLGRRNLTPEQYSYFRGEIYNATKQSHGGDRISEGACAQNEHSEKTAEKLAKKQHVSPATIRRDGEYATAVNKIAEKAGADAKQAILAGQTDLTKKEIPALAEQEPEAIKKTVEERKTGGASRAKAKKQAEGQAQGQGKAKCSATTRAIKAMQEASRELEAGGEAFGDHGAKAVKALKAAIQKCEAAIRFVEGD